jgi:hypothetical protein
VVHETLPPRDPPLRPLGFADKSVRVDVFEGAGLGELGHLALIQLPAGRAEVVFELFQRSGADDG